MTTLATPPLRIGIAGAGLLGRLLAFTLSRAGHRVEVHDPAAGPEARGAACSSIATTGSVRCAGKG